MMTYTQNKLIKPFEIGSALDLETKLLIGSILDQIIIAPKRTCFRTAVDSDQIIMALKRITRFRTAVDQHSDNSMSALLSNDKTSVILTVL